MGVAVCALVFAGAAGAATLWWSEDGNSQLNAGPNASLVIFQGTFQPVQFCKEGVNDSFFPFTDIYVVAAGSAAVGGELHDLTGAKNTVEGASGGLFIDEFIGTTGPDGTLPAGTYDVVYDECQNGKLDPEDTVFHDAITVTIPDANIPPLPSSLAAMKAKAGQEADSWQQLVDGYQAYLQAMEVYEAYECITDLAGCAVGKLTDYLKEQAREALGLADVKQAALDVVLNDISHYRGIQADPPDPALSTLTLLAPQQRVDAPSADPLLVAGAGLATAAANESALAQALLHAMERYQGAAAAGDAQWALVQARALEVTAAELSNQLPAVYDAAAALDTALAADARPLDAVAANLETIRARLASSGPTADEVRTLRNLGLSQQQIDDLVDAVVADDAVSGFTVPALRSSLASLANTLVDAQPAYAAFASGAHGMFDTLQSQVMVPQHLPYASAGGPYTATEGTAVAVDGSGSLDPDGTIASYAWDTDGDGAFDDATGATPSVTFDRPGVALVGLQVTDDAGNRGVDYAHVTVAEANRPPQVTSFAPALDEATVAAGSSLAFSVATSDPEGDPVTVRWFLGNLPAGTGPTFAYSPTAADVGVRLVRAVVADGPFGGTAETAWTVSVVAADGDGDGWGANVDCDDAAATVNPGAREILDNGVDDDCDPATLDDGTPPTVAFTTAAPVATVGEPFAFADASTDPDDDMTDWAWDFGDGETSAQRSPTHVYDTRGVYDVTLTVTDAHGKQGTATRTIHATLAPTAAFTVSPEAPLPGVPVTFTDASTDPDGTIASWHWDFGDGSGSDEQSPTHTYAKPGDYTVVLTVTDDDGATGTATQTLHGPSAPEAAFGTAPGIDVASVLNGASVEGVSSELSSSWVAERALDGSSSSGWQTASGQKAEQWLTVRLGARAVVDHVVLLGRNATTDPQDVEVLLSDSGADAADFTTVAAATLPRESAPHELAFAPTRARYVKLLVHTNWGASTLFLPSFEVWTRARSGGNVSVLEGATSRIAAVSSESSSFPASNLLDGNPNTLWRTVTGQKADQSVMVELGGGRTYTLDRLVLDGRGITDQAKTFQLELAATDDPAAFATVLSGTMTRTAGPQTFSFPATAARFARLRVLDTWGGSCCVDLRDLALLTPAGRNAAGSIVGGTIVGEIGSPAALDPSRAIDSSTSTYWQSANGAVADQGFVVLLHEGAPFRVDSVRLRAPNSTNGLGAFEVAVSASPDPASFRTVLTGTLPRDGQDHLYAFDPADATYVRLLARGNQGGTVIQVQDFQVFSSSIGGPTVSFDDRTTDADDDVASWHWDFGDGTTSTEPSPTHTYAAPGTYTVQLSVEDATGLADEASASYTVVSPPRADFTWSPVEPGEGTSTHFADATAGDAAIVSRRWTFGDTSASSTQQAPSHSFRDDGDWPVTLEVTDSAGQTASVTKTVHVTNVAPTADARTDATLPWGRAFEPRPSYSDAGQDDRAHLTCRWDWGDGASDSAACSTNGWSHAYADAGTYTATLTVTDPDGASDSDTAKVTVTTHATFVSAFAVPGSIRNGHVDVVARLWDRVGWEPVAGKPLTLSLGSDVVTGSTEADGTFAATLPFAAPTGTLRAAFAGDDHRTASSDEDALSAASRLPAGDIVFLFDESGSMGDDQAAVKRNVTDIAAQLGASVDFQLGVVGFGSSNDHVANQGDPHLHVALTDDLPAFDAALGELVITGGYEPGLQAVKFAMGDAMGYRPGAGVCAVMFGDEAPQGPVRDTEAIASLAARNGVFLGVITPPGGAYNASSPAWDYVDTATASGGATFSIVDFRTNAEPVLAAILDKCVATIVERPDISVTVDDGVDTVHVGQQPTYAVTVRNDGAVRATGIVARAQLPAELAFVSAAGGGSQDGATVSWPSFALDPGASKTLTFTARVASALPPALGTLDVTATVADDGASGADLTPANNSATDADAFEADAAPHADDQTLATDEDTPLPVTLTGADADGGTLAFSVASGPAHGTLTGTAPSLTYTPDADYHGPDAFTYTASDGALESEPATVAITVRPVDDPPVARDDAIATDEDAAVEVPAGDLLANDDDPDGDSLAVAAVGTAAHGTVTLAGGAVRYEPAPDFAGEDSFPYTASDGNGGSDTATVTVTVRPVDDPPVARDDAATVAEDGSVAIDVLANDAPGPADEADQRLAVTGATAPAHGTAEIADGRVVYRPAADRSGDDSFSYTVCEDAAAGGLCATASVLVTVTPVNDAPTAADASVSLAEDDAPVEVDLGELAADLETADADLAYEIVRGPAKGVLTGAGPVLSYDSDQDANGADSFTYRVVDRGDPDGCEAGPACSAPLASEVRTVTIVIAPVNDAPTVSLAPAGPVDEGAAAIELHATAHDVDGDALSYAWTTDAGELAGDGATASFAADDGPATAHVAVTVSDGQLTAAAATAVEVRNVAPAVDAGPALEGVWGLPLAFAGSVSDPSDADTAAGLAPHWSFGDGASADGADASHAYAAPGAYTATLAAADKDGGTGSDSTAVTVRKRATSLRYTGSTDAVYGFATLSAQLDDAVDAATARLAGREVVFRIGTRELEATADAAGVAVATPLLPFVSGEVTVEFAGDDLYLRSSAAATLTVHNGPGKVTAGTLRSASEGRGGFNVQSDGTAVKGELQWQKAGVDFHAHELTALGVAPDGRSAWLAGTGTDGRAFVAYVEDAGEPGRDDVFRLWIAGRLETAEDGRLAGGNVQIHG